MKIHIHRYAASTNTKGGRSVPTQRGLTLDMKEFRRMIKVEKRLFADDQQQLSSLPTVPSLTDCEAKQGEKEATRHTSNQPPTLCWSPSCPGASPTTLERESKSAVDSEQWCQSKAKTVSN